MSKHQRATAVLPLENLKVNKMMMEVAQHLVVTGNVNAAAEAAGVNAGTVRTWMAQNEDFQTLLTKFTDAAVKEMKAEMISVAREAVEVQREIMKDVLVDPKVRISAAQDILDRIGLNEEKKQQIDINNNYNYFAEMPDDELDKIIDIKFEEVIEDVKGDKGTTGECEARET